MATTVTLTLTTDQTDPLDYSRALMEAAEDAAQVLRYRGVTMCGGDLDVNVNASYSAKVDR